VVLGLVGWALGIDPSLLIGGAEMLNRQTQPQVQQAPPTARRTGSPQDEMGRFVAKVLGSTEVQWRQIFSKEGKNYRAPVLVLYRGRTQAQCGGVAQAAMGPFYCPADQKVYLDTSFFDQIATRFRGCDVGSKSCQFSQAYVIAHEVGHHVQNLLGILPKAQQLQRTVGSKAEANQIQVRVELQADCLAGVWANQENESLKRQGKPPFIEPGDVEAALRTAAAIGDDTLQRRSQGYVVPDSFTHGSAEQRQRWFNTGFRSGTVASCNTFASAQM
jgi:predicted metalloprotease